MNADDPITPLYTVDDSQDLLQGDVWVRQHDDGNLRTGDQIDRYTVESILGEGGAATVYRVRHQTLGVVRALKVLRLSRVDQAERFLAEGRVQARLVHPHLVRVHDALMVRGRPALLLDLIEGPTLAQHLTNHSPHTEEIERLFRGIVQGVAHAHRAGVVHRDLKPTNVLLDQHGRTQVPRVSDFGIARALENSGEGWTQTGGLLGTPAYMAPEQVQSPRDADERADIFSMGVILYEMCCGVRPFQGADMLSLLNAVHRGDYVPVENAAPNVPAHLRNAVAGCLQANPEHRIPDCTTLLRVLDGHVWEKPAPKPPETLDAQEDQPRTAAKSQFRAPWYALLLCALVLDGAGWAALSLHAQEQDRLHALKAQNLQLTQQRDAEKQRAEGHKLYGEAWRLAQDEPARALALLRGASTLLPNARPGGEKILQHESLWKLTQRGAASSVLTREDVEWTSVAFTPDGKTIMAGNDQGEVVSWDRDTGQEKFRFLYYEDIAVGDLHVLEDPPLVIAQHDVYNPAPLKSLALRAYSWKDGRLVHELGFGGMRQHLQLTDDQALVATQANNEVLKLWNAASGQPYDTILHPGSLGGGCFALSPEGKFVASNYRNLKSRKEHRFSALRVTRVKDKEVVLDAPLVEAGCLLNFVGDDLFFQGPSGTWRIDLASQTRTQLQTKPVVTQQYSPNRRFLVNNHRLSNTTLWELPDMRPIANLSEGRGRVYHAVFSKNNRWLATSHTDKTLRLWEADSGELFQSFTGHNSWVLASAVSVSGDIATAGKDGTVRLWHNALPRIENLSQFDLSNTLIAQSRQGNTLALVQKHQITVRDLVRGEEKQLEAPIEDIQNIHISPSGRYLAVLNRKGQVAIHDQKTSEPWRLWKSDPSMVRMRFSAQEEALLAWRGNYFAYYDLERGPVDAIAVTHPVRQLRVRQGKIFLSTERGMIGVMDMVPNAEIRRFVPEGKDQGAMAVTLSGHIVATADWSGTISVRDGTSGRLLRTWRGHNDGIPGLFISPNQNILASLSWDETVKLWDLESGELLHTLKGHDRNINTLRFSPDGSMVATGGRDSTVRVWDVASGDLLRLEGTGGEVHFLSWSRENRLRARTSSGTLWSWHLGDRMPEPPTLRSTGSLTNLRVCRESSEVVRVSPFPSPESVWAPPALCKPQPTHAKRERLGEPPPQP